MHAMRASVRADLSFRLHRARTAQALADAAEVRAVAYGRHIPSLGREVRCPDAHDTSTGVAVFVCDDKASGAPVGTVRIQSNAHAPLLIEASAKLPDSVRGVHLAEVTRLAVRPGADPRVKLALFKAVYWHSLQANVRYLIAGARSPALIRQYVGLGFEDLFPDQAPVRLSHAGDLPHRVFRFAVDAAERAWARSGHRLYEFMIVTRHPDIDLDAG